MQECVGNGDWKRVNCHCWVYGVRVGFWLGLVTMSLVGSVLLLGRY